MVALVCDLFEYFSTLFSLLVEYFFVMFEIIC